MDPVTAAGAIASVLVAKALTLWGLRIRQYWKARNEQARHTYVSEVVTAIAGRGALQLSETHSDGHRIRVTVSCAPAGRPPQVGEEA
ncbi:hypothetical protein [Streptomyces sp. NPDC026673]|uniref:hypothetical protein n=1 Tax=Streptomyces sp. NPDC026673 TaxID=3155724 RepID=UPI0033C50859